MAQIELALGYHPPFYVVKSPQLPVGFDLSPLYMGQCAASQVGLPYLFLTSSLPLKFGQSCLLPVSLSLFLWQVRIMMEFTS